MDDFDRQFVENTIRQIVGPVSRIDLCSRENFTPMTMFIGLAEESAPWPIDLFWVDEGIPAHFTLPDGRSSPVIFHSRQLELTGLVRSLYTTDGFDQLREDLSGRICLRMVAEFLLARGWVDQAIQCLAKSRLDSGVFMAEPSLWDLEHLPIDERYIGIWFFALGHEIGHSVRSDVAQVITGHECLSLEWIAAVVDKLVDAYTSNCEARSTLRSILLTANADDRSSCYASARQVQREAVCDVFSALTLCRAANEILPKVNKQLSSTELFQEILLAFSSLLLIEQCRILADWFQGTENELKNKNFAMSNIAINARSHILRSVLLDVAESTRFLPILGSGFDALSKVDPGRVNECAQFIASRSVPIHNGLQRARSFLSSAEMRDTEIFYSYLTTVSQSAATGMEAARFVKNARMLGRSTPEIDMLAKEASVFLNSGQ